MRIVGRYSFNGGHEYVVKQYPGLVDEVSAIVHAIDSRHFKTKTSEEKTMLGKMLYSPGRLNAAFKQGFLGKGWKNHRVKCEYPRGFYEPGYSPGAPERGAFRDMDFVKEKLGVEVQFGKYSFMVYNVAAKMTIFRNLGVIDAGIEIVPVRNFVDQFSSGVSYYEQFLWDLENRGVSNIDIPVLVMGIDSSLDSDEVTVAPPEAAVSSGKRSGARPGPKSGATRKRSGDGATID
ncbi:MAG: BglII/BstYI family type II restriction endonuclease [Thermoplasmata archaeon]